jgi:hypothetical protein
MLTNLHSYTVSDEYLTPKVASDPLARSFEQTVLDPCHHVMDWEDSLEERPVVFKIRDYYNNEDNSCTVSDLTDINKDFFSITTLKFAPINIRRTTVGV